MTAEDPVVVADPALLACMNEWLQQPATATISPAQVIKIRATLECSRMGIQTLEGAQRLQFVSAFVLSHNQISALQPLSGLHNLLSLYLDHNRICDLRPLAGIPDLVELHLQGQQCEYRLPPGPVCLDNPVFAPDGSRIAPANLSAGGHYDAATGQLHWPQLSAGTPLLAEFAQKVEVGDTSALYSLCLRVLAA